MTKRSQYWWRVQRQLRDPAPRRPGSDERMKMYHALTAALSPELSPAEYEAACRRIAHGLGV